MFSVIIGLVITIFPLLLFSHEVNWKLESKVLQFGQNAKLVCNGTGCIGALHRGWMGGHPYRLLCTDEKSRDPDKYEWKPEKDGTAFEMMIKNLSITDLNCNYTCNCGFNLLTKVLTFRDSIFYPLDAKLVTSSSTKEDDAFIIDVDIRKVYPFPECKQYLVYANKTIEDYLTISRETDSDGIFVNLNMKSKVNCEEHNSLINATIMCSLKNEAVNVFSERIDCRHANDKRSLLTVVSITIGGISAALMALLVVFVIYKRIKKSSKEKETRNQTVTLIENYSYPIPTEGKKRDDNMNDCSRFLINE